MKIYNALIILCHNAIHLQQASYRLWKWIDWMCIAENVHSLWTQTMWINSLPMHFAFIVGTSLIFQTLLKGITPEILALCWLWMLQYSLYVYTWENFFHIFKHFDELSSQMKNYFLWSWLCTYRAGGNGPATPVLAGPDFSQGKNELPFLQKVINQSASMILELVRLIIFSYIR